MKSFPWIDKIIIWIEDELRRRFHPLRTQSQNNGLERTENGNHERPNNRKEGGLGDAELNEQDEKRKGLFRWVVEGEGNCIQVVWSNNSRIVEDTDESNPMFMHSWAKTLRSCC